MASLKRRAQRISAAIEAEAWESLALSKGAERRRSRMLTALATSVFEARGGQALADSARTEPGQAPELEAAKDTELGASASGRGGVEADADAVAGLARAGAEAGEPKGSRPKPMRPYEVSLAARSRKLRAEIAAEEEKALAVRPRPAALRFSRGARDVLTVAPAKVFRGGKLVAQEPVRAVFAAPAAGEVAEVAPPPAKPEPLGAEPGGAGRKAPGEATARAREASGQEVEAEPDVSDTGVFLAVAAPAVAGLAAAYANAGARAEQAEKALRPEGAPDRGRPNAAESARPSSAQFAAEGPSREKKPHRPRRWPWLAAAVVALAGGYGATAAAVGGTVPEGTTVAGVDIGGVRPETAIAALERKLAPKTEEPFEVTVGKSDDAVKVDPVDYHLGLDAAATVAQVTGFNLHPASVAAHLFGGKALDPVVSFDDGKLALVAEDLQGRLEGGYTNATVAFDGATPKVVPAKAGLGLAPETTQRALTVDMLGASKPLALKASKMEPLVSEAEASQALEKYAKPLVSGPVTMVFNGQELEASPQVLAEAASFPPVGGIPVLELDGARLAQVILDTNPEGVVYGEDAKIEIVDHERVEITPSTEGIGIDEDTLASDVAAAIADGSRKVTARTAVSEARFSTEDAEAMGITEIVAEIDTPITWEYVRTLNLEAGAAKTTGTLVKPGETFSLLEALGPIDTAHGFYAAGMIIGGQHKDGIGGGLSQISTNTFNLGYRAGFEDIEHHPHSYYFDRYPMGAESTLAVGSLDMRWRNNTPYGALIDSWVADGYVHSRLWSTKYWDVDIQTSEPRNVVYSGWKTVVSYSCEYTPKGNNGFTVTVTRTVGREGEKPRTDTNDVTYQPDYGTNCVTPKPKPTAAPQPAASSASAQPAAEAPAAAPAPAPAPAEPAPEGAQAPAADPAPAG